MKQARYALLSLFLFFLCLISACKMTEQQIRDQGLHVSPSLLEQAAMEGRSLAETDSKPSGKGTKIQWFLLTAAILAGVIMILASDRGERKKESPAKRSTARKRRKK